MKINELGPAQQVKKEMGNDYGSLEIYLKKHGFNVIGRGGQADVWYNQKIKGVLKIFRSDECYIKFLEFVRNNKDNPHLPLVYGNPIKLPIKPFYGIRLEKLNPIPNKIWDNLILGYYSPKNDLLLSNIRKKYKTFFDTLVELEEYLLTQYDECMIDFSSDNVMMRGNIPVIIDPYITR